MKNRCPKCKQKLQGGEFLCPRCGHILGQAVCSAPKQKRKIPWRQIFRVLGLILLIAAILAAAWGVNRLAAYLDPTDPTLPTPGPTEPATTAAPLISYHVNLSADTKYWISGITVHFCKDGKELYSGQVESDGKITFVAPRGEGYYIRLSNLFPSQVFHYGNLEIPFPEGSNLLTFHMENKDIDYTVRVVNSKGQPVPDVKVGYVPHSGQQIQYAITGSDGLCVFTAAYDPDATCSIVSIPNEYVMLEYDSLFEMGSFETVVMLQTYEECNIDAEHIFTVNFRDEYGQPVKDLYVILYGQKGDDASTWESLYYVTNKQGSFTFAGYPEYTYKIHIPNNPDYFGKRFTIEPGTHELNVELYLHTPLPEYTYSVKLQNQNGEPIEGVRIAVPIGEKLVYYTSDQEGLVTFQSEHWDPQEVYFMIASTPAGYGYGSDGEILKYSFPANRRDMVITLQKSVVEYNVILYWDPENGNSTKIMGAEFDILVDGKRYLCKLDDRGQCKVELPRVVSSDQISFDFTKLPEKYQPYIVNKCVVSVEESFPYISIRIGPVPKQDREYMVTVYVPTNDGYEPLQRVRLQLIYQGRRVDCETGANGSYWTRLPHIDDILQLGVELISLPEPYEDYCVWDYTLDGDKILIFLGPAPEPPVESP